VPLRGPFVRLLWWIAALAGGVLAVVGGLGLRGPGMVAVGVAGMLAACIAGGVARDEAGDDRRALLESAVQTAAWTVGLLLVLAGVAALAGGAVALLAGVTGALAWLAVRMSRSRNTAGGSTRLAAVPPGPAGVDVRFRPVRPGDISGPGEAASPLSVLTTAALGREWVRTTAALGGKMTPSERQALVRRREETLDELERRDPAGFARWLADGPVAGSDPAEYVRGRPVQEDPTAGTDAA
jgi:hypothetical protein